MSYRLKIPLRFEFTRTKDRIVIEVARQGTSLKKIQIIFAKPFHGEVQIIGISLK